MIGSLPTTVAAFGGGKPFHHRKANLMPYLPRDEFPQGRLGAARWHDLC
jgi:hypothetical protein